MSIENKIKEVDKLNAELDHFNKWVNREAKICFVASEVNLVKAGYWSGTVRQIHGATKSFCDKILKEISSTEFLEPRIKGFQKEMSDKITIAKQAVLDELK